MFLEKLDHVESYIAARWVELFILAATVSSSAPSMGSTFSKSKT